MLAPSIHRIINYLLLLPLLFYLWRRGRKDRLYSQHLRERFGIHPAPPDALQDPVWVHAVSLGELRSAVPLIKALLNQGETIVTTHFTPVGRREAQSLFATEIEQGRVQVAYVPLELHWAFKRFYKTFKPKYGLVMEVEFWPCMIDSARKNAIPLFLCNGQYPGKSYHRDIKGLGLRASLVSGFAGAMVKSDLQQQRFKSLGLNNVAITGELRFDQPIPQSQLSAADRLRHQFYKRHFVITIASAVEGEDDLYIRCIQRVQQHLGSVSDVPVLFVYVPRAPERFTDVEKLLGNAGLQVTRRTTMLNENLVSDSDDPASAEVLLGDSMGEMYFYLQLSNLVVVGGGFTPAGAHNISEAFAVSKPVLVGPTLWTIEYPAVEAMDAGVLETAADADQLSEKIISAALGTKTITPDQVAHFFSQHQGAIDKTLSAITRLLENTSDTTSH